MDGTVTVSLVGVCFSVAAVAVGIALYISNKYQSKSEATKVEDGLKEWIKKVEADVARNQSSLERIGENVSYIRGLLEANKPQGG
jgi:hypothetical protein